MSTARKATKRKSPKKHDTAKRVVTQLRYLDKTHFELVRKAAQIAGLSVNSWLVNRTIAAARKEVPS